MVKNCFVGMLLTCPIETIILPSEVIHAQEHIACIVINATPHLQLPYKNHLHAIQFRELVPNGQIHSIGFYKILNSEFQLHVYKLPLKDLPKLLHS